MNIQCTCTRMHEEHVHCTLDFYKLHVYTVHVYVHVYGPD